MEPKKIILVTGATGAQGGSVVEALLRNNKYKVRVFTRNPNSPRVAALEKAGAEIAVGNLNHVNSIQHALKGVYGVFGVTNFREHFEEEQVHGKNLIDAISRSGVEHFIYSSLASYKKLSNGELEVPEYDLKGELEEYVRDLQLPFTFVRLGFYYENFINLLPLREDKQGNLHFGFPQGNTKLAMASPTDLGEIVSAIFNHPVEYIGRTVGVVGEDRPCSEYAYIMSRVLQRNVYYTYVPHEKYVNTGFPGAVELANMFEVQRRFIPNRQMDLIESYGLNPKMKTFEKWLEANKVELLNSIKTTAAVV